MEMGKKKNGVGDGEKKKKRGIIDAFFLPRTPYGRVTVSVVLSLSLVLFPSFAHSPALWSGLVLVTLTCVFYFKSFYFQS